MAIFSRPSKDDYFLAMAALVSVRATCRRRRVGCVLVDKYNHVLATGYNGVAAGQPHCLDVACPGAELPSGTGLETCQAIHAEQNAILQCRDVQAIETAYITTSPCSTCTKLLMNTGCKRIVFIEGYTDTTPQSLWKGEWTEHGTVEHVFTEVGMGSTQAITGLDERQLDFFRRGDVGSEPNDERSGRSQA